MVGTRVGAAKLAILLGKMTNLIVKVVTIEGRGEAVQVQETMKMREKKKMTETLIGEMIDRGMKRDLHPGIMIKMMKEIDGGLVDKSFL